MAAALNYAAQYSQALDQAFPYVLNFGALYATPNNGRYKWGDDGKTIYIPTITTTGRVNANRDTIATAARNYDNSWQPKTLTNQRKWSTLVHPKDVDQTNMVTTISNITQVFNEEQKFPEMDAYLASKLFADYTTATASGGLGKTVDKTALTKANVLTVFDSLMLEMTKNRVPLAGRILYVTPEVKQMIDSNSEISRTADAQSGVSTINREVEQINLVKIVVVPSELMKSNYDFTEGWEAETTADQINMMLIHPNAVITPVSYAFSALDAPSGLSEGKYVYYEESFEDVFILNHKADGIQFNITEYVAPTP